MCYLDALGECHAPAGLLGGKRTAARGSAASGSAAGGSEIVVCGRRPGGEPFPTAGMERRYAPRKIRAEMSLGGSTVRAFTEAVEFPRGEVRKRIMVGIKLPF